MDALTTLERLRPDDELLDDDALERIWNTAILRASPERRPETDRDSTELSLGVAAADEQRSRRHRRTDERASAAEQQPRRWPALAAAAVVLLTTGSVVWMISDRDPADIVVAPSDAPSLSARLEGAEEYPLTAATIAVESVDVPMLAIEEPDTLTVAQAFDGTTVFRVSGLVTAPGTKVYEAVCAGVPGRSVGCEGPSLVDLPWVLTPPHLSESEQLSIWGDVPADTAAVLVTDGEAIRWQRPVDGLAVWPRPTTADWTVEAIDADGTTIITVDESTQEQLRTATEEAFDPTDTRDSDTAVIQQVRECLVANGAEFGADNVRPIFPPGVSGQEIWALCVDPLFDQREISPTVTNPVDSTNMVIDPPPPGDPFRTDVNSSTSTLRIYTQERPDPENGPWMMVGWTPDGSGGLPMTGDPTEPDRQFFDGGRGYVISDGIDPTEVRRLINGATVEADGRRSIDPSELPDGLELAFDGDSVSDVGRRPRDGTVSEVAWWASPANGPFVRLLVAADPDMSGWRAGRVGILAAGTAVTDTVVDSHPAYLRSLPGVRVLSWHDGSRWLQLIASDATDDELLRMAATVRQADSGEWGDIRLADNTEMLGELEQATVGPSGSNTTPILSPTTIGSVTLPDGTVMSITVADFGTLTLSGADGFVIYAISAGATGAVGNAMRIPSDASPAAATGDLVYGIVVAGSTLTIRDDASGEEVPVALTDELEPVNGFVGFAARLPAATTYATLTITDPTTGITSESPIGY
jgi:hypothetical protein